MKELLSGILFVALTLLARITMYIVVTKVTPEIFN